MAIDLAECLRFKRKDRSKVNYVIISQQDDDDDLLKL